MTSPTCPHCKAKLTSHHGKWECGTTKILNGPKTITQSEECKIRVREAKMTVWEQATQPRSAQAFPDDDGT